MFKNSVTLIFRVIWVFVVIRRCVGCYQWHPMVLPVTSYQVHRLLPVTTNGVTCDKISGASAVTSDIQWCYLWQDIRCIGCYQWHPMVLSVTSYQVQRLLPVTSNGVTCDKLSGVSVVTSVRYRSYHCYVSENIWVFCKEVECCSLNPRASRASERSELARGASFSGVFVLKSVTDVNFTCYWIEVICFVKKLSDAV